VPTSLEDVLRDPPLVHADDDTGEVSTHGLQPAVLRWLAATVRPGARTLETGSGLSTLTFALAGALHTCVVPNQPEVDRLLAYGRERGIPVEEVRFEVAPSERVLPSLDLGELDLVLIDGSHSFPQPFIDWFYTHPSLALGGRVVVDDTHVWTGRVLRDFLDAEPEWVREQQWLGRTAAFRKVAPTDPDKLWTKQPLVWRNSVMGPRLALQQAVELARSGEWRDLGGRVRGVVGTEVRRRLR
jgi:hypothetical protein